jgi:hypothetical protein
MDLFFGKLLRLKVTLAVLAFSSCQQENGSDEQSNNGTTVKPGKEPGQIEKSTVYIASWHKDESKNVNCSGVALTPTKILTAAHCVYKKEPGVPPPEGKDMRPLTPEDTENNFKKFENKEGIWVIFGTARGNHKKLRKVKNTAIHERYPKAHEELDKLKMLTSAEFSKLSPQGFPLTEYPDLAVLTLEVKAPDGYAPILNLSGSPQEISEKTKKKVSVQFAGWGDKGPDDQSARTMNTFSGSFGTVPNPQSFMFILDDTEGAKKYDGCGGDSGGALYDQSLSKVLGLLSMSYCGYGASYFVEVASYAGWIKSKLAN